MNLDGLYDGVDSVDVGGDRLYEDTDVSAYVPDTMLYRDKVIVQPMTWERTPWGINVVEDGDPVYCLCNVEGRTQKSSTFSTNWAQDTVSGDQLGLIETTLLRMLAPEWHGNFYSVVWFNGSAYELDGNPVQLPHATDMAYHWQVMLRRIVNSDFSPGVEPPVVPEGGVTWGMSSLSRKAT